MDGTVIRPRAGHYYCRRLQVTNPTWSAVCVEHTRKTYRRVTRVARGHLLLSASCRGRNVRYHSICACHPRRTLPRTLLPPRTIGTPQSPAPSTPRFPSPPVFRTRSQKFSTVRPASRFNATASAAPHRTNYYRRDGRVEASPPPFFGRLTLAITRPRRRTSVFRTRGERCCFRARRIRRVIFFVFFLSLQQRSFGNSLLAILKDPVRLVRPRLRRGPSRIRHSASLDPTCTARSLCVRFRWKSSTDDGRFRAYQLRYS